MNQKTYDQEKLLKVIFMLLIFLLLIIIMFIMSFSANTMKKAERVQQETLNMIDLEIYTNNDIYYCDFNNKIIITELGKRLIFDSDLEMKDFIAETTANESK